jgi:hypothetical protein
MRYITLAFVAIASIAYAANINWFSFLGKTFQDGDVRAQFDSYGKHTSHEFRNDYETQMNWTEHGISISMNDEGEIQKIYFFNDQYNLYNTIFNRFNGALPLGVTLDMGPEKIKEKIGTPTEENGTNYKEITYRTTYEYKFLFKKGTMQYMRIGLLPKDGSDD